MAQPQFGSNPESNSLTLKNVYTNKSKQQKNPKYSQSTAGDLSVSPNPFNQSTVIEFNLEEAGNADLTILDVTGREITKLTNGTLAQGTHQFTFVPEGLASGVYIAKLTINNSVQTAKMILTR